MWKKFVCVLWTLFLDDRKERAFSDLQVWISAMLKRTQVTLIKTNLGFILREKILREQNWHASGLSPIQTKNALNLKFASSPYHMLRNLTATLRIRRSQKCPALTLTQPWCQPFRSHFGIVCSEITFKPWEKFREQAGLSFSALKCVDLILTGKEIQNEDWLDCVCGFRGISHQWGIRKKLDWKKGTGTHKKLPCDSLWRNSTESPRRHNMQRD